MRRSFPSLLHFTLKIRTAVADVIADSSTRSQQRTRALRWKDRVSTAPLFADFPATHSETADENTVMTEYWLRFVSVRQMEEAPPAEFPPQPKGIPHFENILRVNPAHTPEIRLSFRDRMKTNALFTTLQKLF
jgi:hypothetical protein